MDFFDQQAQAKRNTGRLILYFAIAVVLITVGVNLVTAAALNAGSSFTQQDHQAIHSTFEHWLSGPHWIWTTLVTLSIIGLGSLFTFIRLSSGGRAVAQMVDARLVDLNTTDARERRFINVVEEMAIASGTPVPELYIQDGELGINAFVAGYQIREAVLVITEGALAKLNRDQLQGVVGHEFSHILNGDMRINVRLISVLAGLLVLSQIGGFMMRSLRFSRSSREGAPAVFAIAGVGIALFALGYIGLAFGRIIKAAVSRQREFLADAASVQFTRNSQGIADALFKIGHTEAGSILDGAHAEDMSHMCFGETVDYKFSSLFATHPPIADRIEAVCPGFVPTFDIKEQTSETVTADTDSDSPADDTSESMATAMMGSVITAGVLMDSIGSSSSAHMAYAKDIHQEISPQIHEHIHQPLGARAVIYALVLTQANHADLSDAMDLIKNADDEATAEAVTNVLESIDTLGDNCRLPLVELSFPALGRLHVDQKQKFIKTLEAVIRSDNRFTLFEFALLTIIMKHLTPDAGAVETNEYNNLQAVAPHVKTLVSLFARLGASTSDQRLTLFTTTMKSVNIDVVEGDFKKASVERLTVALNHLDRLSPLLKRPVLNACADCVISDGTIKPVEFEMLRATSAALDCPMPPLLQENAA